MKKVIMIFAIFGALTFGITSCGGDSKEKTEHHEDDHNHESEKGHQHEKGEHTHHDSEEHAH